MRIRLWTLSAFLLGLAPSASRGGPLAVAVSVVPHAWLIEQIVGDAVEVAVLVGTGESPETFTPSDAQVTRLMRSDIYFRTGVPFEEGPWFAAIRRSSRLEIVDLRAGVAPPAPEAAGDPHIWLSPRRLQVQARSIVTALTRRDPQSGSLFQGRVERLIRRLDLLDQRIRSRLRPYAGRSFFVFHPSWSYFAEDYDLRQVAIEREGKEPSDSEMTSLQRHARAERVSVIFVQPQIDSRSAAALAAAIGGRIETLDPLARDVVENLEFVATRLEDSFR